MKYHPLLRITHWAMAFGILGLIAMGWYMNTLTPEEGRYDLYDWHKSFGMVVLMLFPLRFILRKITTVPPLPSGIKPIEKKLSHLTHILLYIGMLFVPVIGYVYSTTGGHDVPLFNLTVPAIFSKNKEIFEIAGELHEIAAYTVLGLVALHIIGALKQKHKFFEKPENDVLNRML